MKFIFLFDAVSKGALYLLAFLLPLWVLPFTIDPVQFQKQALLAVLLFVAVVAWFAKLLNERVVRLRKSWVHIPVLLLVGVVGISTIFSLWRYGSFWGWPLHATDNFLTVFLFAALYFFVVHSIQDRVSLSRFFVSLIAGVVAAGLISILQLYRAFPATLVPAANTIGTVNSVAILAAMLIPLSLLVALSVGGRLRWVFSACTGLLLLTVMLINFQSAWLVLGAGSLVLLGFGMWNLRKKTRFGWVSFPMALLIVALFFLVFPISLPYSPQIPLEVSPAQRAELEILQKVVGEKPILGTGPGTFVFDYTKHHTPLLNQTIFWGTRFGAGASEFLDWVITKGVLGGLALLGVLVAAGVLGFRKLLKEAPDAFAWMVGLGAYGSLAAGAVALFLYPFNFTLWFLFWMVLASVVMFLEQEPRTVSIAPPSFLAVASSFIFLIVLMFGLGLLFAGGQKYAAEVQYFRGARLAAGGEEEKAIPLVMSAVRLNPASDLYWRDLAQLYVSYLNRPNANQGLGEQERVQRIQAIVNNAIAAANQAVVVGRANVANWNVRGFVYRNFIAVPGAAPVVVESYEKAIELDPSSPFSWTELARAYIMQAQNLARQEGMEEKREEALRLAIEKLQKAIELKADYAPAHYLTAAVFEQQGKSDEAVAKLEETKKVAGRDVGLAFQLGVVYWQRQDVEKARQEFERALALNPNYSNARYMLGLAYDRQKEKEKALAAFQKVAELNPENEEVKKIIANIQAGRPALEGVAQAQPPIGENPPEIEQ